LERTTTTLTNCVSLSTEQIINKVNETVKAFVDTAEQSDDLTMLAVKYTRYEKELILQQSITLKNDVRQIGQLNEFTRSATQALQLNHEMAHQIKLAVEEAVVNIMEYAYPANTEGTVEIKAEADASQLRFILIDSGAEFDPTEASKADTTLSLDERPIGGLGIFLVRNMLDSINYERKEGKNILTLIKNINHENNR
jgi:sigma-B regulation protein RsbU (phosphoserine phosphatase)